MRNIQKYIAIALVSVLLISACTNNKVNKKKISSSKNNPELLTTMLVVGDIDNYNENLKPLAEELIKKNPKSTFWIMGDGGYGDESSVNSNYKEIAASIPKEKLHMLVGDHDYGTQTEQDYTKENLDNTGSAKELNQEDEFLYYINSKGEIVTTDIDKTVPKKTPWSITGTNDICVETNDLENVDCDKGRIKRFEDSLKTNSKNTSCSIAMWHHPIYASIKNGGMDLTGSLKYGKPLYDASVNNGVDIVINGDHHEFLATKPIDINGKLADPSKTKTTREFIVGTGGAPLSADKGTPKLSSDAIDAEIKNKIGILQIDIYKNIAILNFVTADGSQYKTNVSC